MGLRAAMEENPNVVAIVITVISVTALMWFKVFDTDGRQIRSARDADTWFYDIDADRLFIAPATSNPPIVAPSGGEGVRAHVMACGRCTRRRRFISYLSKYTPEVKEALEKMDETDGVHFDEVWYESTELVSRKEPIEWVPAESEEANAIYESIHTHCEPGRISYCTP